MAVNEPKKQESLSERHYKEVFRKQVFRLMLMYVVPLIVLTFFFQLQYRSMVNESNKLHLELVAENQANMFDLYLKERVLNLASFFNNQSFREKIGDSEFENIFGTIKSDNEVYIDLGLIDSSGNLLLYTGPVRNLVSKNYSQETWFNELINSKENYIITDIYMGLRKKPHFTIALKKYTEKGLIVLKSSLDPKIMNDYMQDIEESNDVLLALVNDSGDLQLASHSVKNLYKDSQIQIHYEKKTGFSSTKINDEEIFYAFSSLNEAKWSSLVFQDKKSNSESEWFGFSVLYIVPIMGLLISITTVVFRSKKMVKLEREKDIVRNQLVQASKLASVGELASGIAHEINNPLAIIGSENGLIRDMLDPQYGMNSSPEDLMPHLLKIDDAVYRCRDITRKLLSFVRQTEFKLDYFSINQLLEELLEGFYERELKVSNIKFKKKYQEDLPKVMLDGNQFKQVALNIVNNAIDAIKPPGKISVETYSENNNVCFAVTDTGCGISPDVMEKIFLPFFSTKEVGKGTGLGLPVSYNIIKSFGGDISVESIPGKGTTFKVILPVTENSRILQ
jgi:two-component system NtrC family sensor kinase